MADLVEFHKVVPQGRSTFGRQSCGKNHHFRQVDQVEHVQLWWQCRPQLCRQYRQTGDEVETQSLDDWMIRWLINIHMSCHSTVVQQSWMSWRQSTFDKRATKAWHCRSWQSRIILGRLWQCRNRLCHQCVPLPGLSGSKLGPCRSLLWRTLQKSLVHPPQSHLTPTIRVIHWKVPHEIPSPKTTVPGYLTVKIARSHVYLSWTSTRQTDNDTNRQTDKQTQTETAYG